MSSNVKTNNSKAIAETSEDKKAAEGTPGQEGSRQPNNRESANETRRHKSIFRLAVSLRTDSREEMYRAMSADEGQSHE